MDNYFESININDSQAWQSLSEPVVKSDAEVSECSEPETEGEKRKRINSSSVSVLTIQLVFCLLILIFAFVSKNYFYGVYSKLIDLYDKEINSSMYFSGDFSKIDYSGIFGAFSDES